VPLKRKNPLARIVSSLLLLAACQACKKEARQGVRSEEQQEVKLKERDDGVDDHALRVEQVRRSTSSSEETTHREPGRVAPLSPSPATLGGDKGRSKERSTNVPHLGKPRFAGTQDQSEEVLQPTSGNTRKDKAATVVRESGDSLKNLDLSGKRVELTEMPPGKTEEPRSAAKEARLVPIIPAQVESSGSSDSGRIAYPETPVPIAVSSLNRTRRGIRRTKAWRLATAWFGIVVTILKHGVVRQTRMPVSSENLSGFYVVLFTVVGYVLGHRSKNRSLAA